MRILSVYFSIPDESAAWWRISNIGRILEEKGHEIEFVHYCSKRTYGKLKDKEKYKKHKFINSSFLTAHIKHLLYVRQNRYDLVYGNTHIGTFYSALSKLTKTPLVFDMHGGLMEEFALESNPGFNTRFIARSLVNRLIDYTDLTLSNKILCVSRRMMESLKKKGVSGNKLAYVTNGVDLDFFRVVNQENLCKMKTELGINDRLSFGYVGNFHKWQGAENYLKAAELLKERDNLNFVVVGGEKTFIKDNTIFIKKVPRETLPAYYSACDILVLPRPDYIATQIAAPTKFAEYASMGKPILSSNVGDAADFIREYKCGIVVENNSPEELARGIREFQELSGEELIRMGKNSRKLAEKEFDWNQIAPNLLKALEEYQ